MRSSPTGEAVGTTTILVVDDDEDFREVITAILGKAGYNVLEASNGADAAAILDRRPGAVDLLITDNQMPKMTGSQLIQYVLRRHPLTRVLSVSGERSDVALPAAIRFLRKPFDRKSLLLKVKEILVEEKTVRAQNAATA